MVFRQKDAHGLANSEDPESALFAQAYMSENLGSLRYEVKGLYYLCSENKGTDQLRGCKKQFFS